MIKTIKQVRYINTETGEVFGEKNHFFPAAFDEEKGYLFWVRKNSCRSFHDVEFPPEMTDIDIGRMTRLSKKVWSNTNMLGYRGNGGIKPYDIEKIAEVLRLKPRQTRNFISKMIKLGVMAKVKVEVGGKKETHYYLNPIYFFSGNRIPLNLYLIFREQLDAVLPEWVKEKFAEQEKAVG